MHVAKWGNSLAVRLRKALVKALGLKVGDEVELSRCRTARSASEKANLERNSSPGWPSSTSPPRRATDSTATRRTSGERLLGHEDYARANIYQG